VAAAVSKTLSRQTSAGQRWLMQADSRINQRIVVGRAARRLASQKP
jgi:hypothetical protein